MKARVAFVLVGLPALCGCATTRPPPENEPEVVAWVNQWPYETFYDLGIPPKPRHPLRYEDWIQQGRGIPGEEDVLIGLLVHHDTRVSLPMVAQLLGETGSARCYPILLKSIYDSDVDVRREAISALGHLRCTEAVGPLSLLLLNDPDETVRYNAAGALGEIGGSNVESALASAITGKEDGVVMIATWGESHAIFQDNHRSDSDAFQAIELIRRFPAAIEKPPFWSDIANSGAYTASRRRWAVLQLVDRYLKPQSTSRISGNFWVLPNG